MDAVLADLRQIPATAERTPTPADLLRTRHGENFPVALWFLPPGYRRHLMAVYVFARFVDYIGDEAPGNRSALLRKVSRDLDKLYEGSDPREPVLRALRDTISACAIPREPLDDLVAANAQDQTRHDYQTYEELLRYCELSANPVGRLVLHVFGQATPANEKLSDRICTALQILEHLQDIGEDAAAGRVYLPAEDRRRFGVDTAELRGGSCGRGLRALVAFETQRAVRLLDDGAPLVGKLSGAARVAITGYLAGGQATAAAIARADFDTLGSAPRPGKGSTATFAARNLLGVRR